MHHPITITDSLNADRQIRMMMPRVAKIDGPSKGINCVPKHFWHLKIIPLFYQSSAGIVEHHRLVLPTQKVSGKDFIYITVDPDILRLHPHTLHRQFR
jgi:hypothetical protein